MLNLTHIPAGQQEDVIASFWGMLRTCESAADTREASRLDRLAVEQWYEQWNRITGDNKVPAWVTREKAAARETLG